MTLSCTDGGQSFDDGRDGLGNTGASSAPSSSAPSSSVNGAGGRDGAADDPLDTADEATTPGTGNDDSSESSVENSDESNVEDSDESSVENSDESNVEDSDESNVENSDEPGVPDSGDFSEEADDSAATDGPQETSDPTSLTPIDAGPGLDAAPAPTALLVVGGTTACLFRDPAGRLVVEMSHECVCPGTLSCSVRIEDGLVQVGAEIRTLELPCPPACYEERAQCTAPFDPNATTFRYGDLQADFVQAELNEPGGEGLCLTPSVPNFPQ